MRQALPSARLGIRTAVERGGGCGESRRNVPVGTHADADADAAAPDRARDATPQWTSAGVAADLVLGARPRPLRLGGESGEIRLHLRDSRLEIEKHLDGGAEVAGTTHRLERRRRRTRYVAPRSAEKAE